MPTGYTAAVADGEITTLRDFALRCARGMGATIMMRDDPMDAPIPERFEPQTDYYDKAIAAAREALDELPRLTVADCDARAAEEHAEALKEHLERLADRRARKARYEAMIAQVEAWTTKAEGIRDFMLEQLRQSLDFDCNDRHEPGAPERLTGEEWRAEKLKKASRDLGYHENERAKEIERTNERNRWLADLRASLPESVPA